MHISHYEVWPVMHESMQPLHWTPQAISRTTAVHITPAVPKCHMQTNGCRLMRERCFACCQP